MTFKWRRWTNIPVAVARGALQDDVLGRSAQLSFYFFIAFFPLLLCVISLLGVFAGAGLHIRQELLNLAYGVLPASAAQLVNASLTQAQSHAFSKLSVGVIVLLWSASSGMSTIMDTLNSAYEAQESRSFLRRRFVAIGLTITSAVLLLAAAAIVVGGAAVADQVAGGVLNLLLKVIRWPVAVALVLLGFALIYFIAPNVKDQEWRWVTPGTVVALTVWVVASAALKVYFHFSSTYGVEYGSLAAVIVLLLWFYVTGAAVLIGGELNHAIEKANTENGAAGAKSEREVSPSPSLRRTAA